METPARCAGCKPRSETLFWLTHDNLEAIVYLWSHRCLSLQPRSSCSDRVTHRSPCEMCTKGNKKNVYVMGLKFFWLRNMDTTWNNSVTWIRGAIRHERNTASRYLIAWYVGFRYGMSIRQDRICFLPYTFITGAICHEELCQLTQEQPVEPGQALKTQKGNEKPSRKVIDREPSNL